MHCREGIFGTDADQFNPDRWETIRPGPAYLPFNGGSRTCVGQQYALTVAGFTIARIAQTFKNIEDIDGEWNGRVGLTMSSLNVVKVRFS